MTPQRLKLLAIDDTPTNQIMLGRALAPDCDLQIATSGAKGLELAIEVPPDLILLDVMMPEIDGFETCRRLKADPRSQAIPVFFLTALSDGESEARSLALGAADYITKPINVAIARQRISNFLEREGLRKLEETIARTIITMGRELDMNVIAEGVESEAQRQFLSAHGCHACQGYLFSRPLPVEHLTVFLQEADR